MRSRTTNATSGRRFSTASSPVSVADFKRLLAELPEPLNAMVLLLGAYGIRISELLALKWEDIDEAVRTISIVRKFTARRWTNQADLATPPKGNISLLRDTTRGR